MCPTGKVKTFVQEAQDEIQGFSITGHPDDINEHRVLAEESNHEEKIRLPQGQYHRSES